MANGLEIMIMIRNMLLLINSSKKFRLPQQPITLDSPSIKDVDAQKFMLGCRYIFSPGLTIGTMVAAARSVSVANNLQIIFN